MITRKEYVDLRNANKEAIYDEICALLTNYEHPEECEGFEVTKDDLYSMLVKIQNNWEYLTADED